ncbi:MAG: site-specific DNA-methyltransferase [Bacteroidetes bacterium HGW-Bacteroidetes-7]|jgi:adenine-specific DNA-methyltransferase|nr:MAG: site-specific DNA-methyltransferase [Bacteroidetes bacterium HGW-Bacteroidetes-7]
MSQNKKQKLELTWIGKGQEPKLEPRILIENPEYSYGDQNTENILIHGDNLLALKALEQEYAGKIKCIYIDPPYNTGNAFEHYDDGVEHSQWLNLMKPRLALLKNLLTNDGSIWISIDADESHYLKVLCDEVFGRDNFIDEVIWQRSYAPINLKKTLSRSHDTILIYAKNFTQSFELNKIPRKDSMRGMYKNYDDDPRGDWKSDNLSVGPPIEKNIYPITNPSGKVCYPPDGYSWRLSRERFEEYVLDNRIWFGKDGTNVPSIKRFISEVKEGVTAMSLWTYQEVGHNQDAKKEAKEFNSNNVFATPKPERLIERILTLGSNPNDLVLDSFLGSGTTAAVAHKMGRRWIGVELGEHAKTHCYPRLKKVVDGEQGGISKAVNWQGGGGFKFYELAPPLLSEDKFGNMVISPEYNPQMLAAAMAKHEGFKYLPDHEKYWKQGISSEKDYIFTTTQYLTRTILDSIYEDLPKDESLLICCTQFEAGIENAYSNINIRKIPSMLLNRCEFKQDSDYSFNIINSPLDELRPETGERIKADSSTKKSPKHTTEIPDLFSQQPND